MFRIATSKEDILKVMVVRGIVFIEEQGVDWEGEIDEHEEESLHVLGEVGFFDKTPVGAETSPLISETRPAE